LTALSAIARDAIAGQQCGCRTGHTFRMSDIKRTTVSQQTRQTAPNHALRIAVEIDDNVSAKYCVEWAAKRPGPHQIELAKRNERAYVIGDFQCCGAAVTGHRLEPSGAQIRRHITDLLFLILPLPSMRDDMGIEISCKNADVERGGVRDDRE